MTNNNWNPSLHMLAHNNNLHQGPRFIAWDRTPKKTPRSHQWHLMRPVDWLLRKCLGPGPKENTSYRSPIGWYCCSFNQSSLGNAVSYLPIMNKQFSYCCRADLKENMAALLLPSLQALQFQYIILILYNLDDYTMHTHATWLAHIIFLEFIILIPNMRNCYNTHSHP
jgi:hypothetical protein